VEVVSWWEHAMTTDVPRGSLLVVDDEVELMLALCDALTDEGFRAVGVTTPDEALNLLRRDAFDVLLTDLMMPDTDGIQLLRAAHEIDQNMVVVVMTGLATDQTAAEALQVGALDYVPKPFRLQQVMSVLGRAMDVRRQRGRDIARPAVPCG
jgi:DNA-binding NtrC family response regulator